MLAYRVAQSVISALYRSIQAVCLALFAKQLSVIFHPCSPAQGSGLQIVGHLDNRNAQLAYLLKVLSFVRGEEYSVRIMTDDALNVGIAIVNLARINNAVTGTQLAKEGSVYCCRHNDA